MAMTMEREQFSDAFKETILRNESYDYKSYVLYKCTITQPQHFQIALRSL